jgi:predicted transcriptional regulator
MLVPLPELPQIPAGGANSIRLQSALTQRLPTVDEVVRYSNSRMIEAEQLADEMRIAFAISRSLNDRSKKISKAQIKEI